MSEALKELWDGKKVPGQMAGKVLGQKKWNLWKKREPEWYNKACYFGAESAVLFGISAL